MLIRRVGKTVLLSGARYTHLTSLFRYMHRKSAVVLTYHGFSLEDLSSSLDNFTGLHLRADLFEQQIQFMKSNYNVVALRSLIDLIRSGSQVEARTAVITIDDGYESIFKIAFPILEKYQVPATVFLTTDFIERRNPLWSDRVRYTIGASIGTNGAAPLRLGKSRVELDLIDDHHGRASLKRVMGGLKAVDTDTRIEEIDELEQMLGVRLELDQDCPDIYRPLDWKQVGLMLESGLVDVGNHTNSHPILSQCSSEEVVGEIRKANDIIQRRLGSRPRLFAYPNGRMSDFDGRTKSALRELGMDCALTTERGFVESAVDPYEIPRMPASNQDGVAAFMAQVSGIRYSLARRN